MIECSGHQRLWDGNSCNFTIINHISRWWHNKIKIRTPVQDIWSLILVELPVHDRRWCCYQSPVGVTTRHTPRRRDIAWQRDTAELCAAPPRVFALICGDGGDWSLSSASRLIIVTQADMSAVFDDGYNTQRRWEPSVVWTRHLSVLQNSSLECALLDLCKLPECEGFVCPNCRKRSKYRCITKHLSHVWSQETCTIKHNQTLHLITLNFADSFPEAHFTIGWQTEVIMIELGFCTKNCHSLMDPNKLLVTTCPWSLVWDVGTWCNCVIVSLTNN